MFGLNFFKKNGGTVGRTSTDFRNPGNRAAQARSAQSRVERGRAAMAQWKAAGGGKPRGKLTRDGSHLVGKRMRSL